jgi:hypothetical protein
MFNIFKAILAFAVICASSASVALADSLPVLGTSVPFAEGGVIGIAAAGVVGGIWLARRKTR